jgi:hypothetical protein
VLAAHAPISAQRYSGTFTVANEVGGVMSLGLQEAGSAVTGTLSSNGVSYQFEGMIEDGLLFGVLRSAEGTAYLEADRSENELWVTLYGTDAQGGPNFDDFTEIDFVLAGNAPAAAPSDGLAGAAGAGSGNPLGQTEKAGGGNPLAGGSTDPYVGTFTDGNVTLQLQGGGGQYQGQVAVAGEIYAVQAQGDLSGIQGIIQAPDGNYQLAAQAQGDGLVVVSGGVQYNLRRQTNTADRSSGFGQTAPGAAAQAGAGGAGQTSTGRALAPGFTEDHPQVREWVQFLAGSKLTRMESYSSGSAGGYSARTDVYLCSDRSFALRDESSVSVDVGGAFGNSGGVGGGQGRWYVITNGQVIGLILEFNSGEAQEFRMDYQNQETYANGERVYVTPAEVCS